MNRRTAIRNVVLLSAGATLLPSCHHEDKISLPLKNISLSGSQEKMLAELSETIFPKTSTFIGAKDIKAHEFVLTMVDDCTAPEDQKKFTSGMKSFEDTCNEKMNRAFENCTLQQRMEFLQQVEKKQDVPDDAVNFYWTVKRYTIQGFTSSKEFMTDIRKYKLVPGGNYRGCVHV
jgi:hypothetical protein